MLQPSPRRTRPAVRPSRTARAKRAPFDARPAQGAGIEDAVRDALVDARPSLEEILSLWPVGHRNRLVLRAKLGTDRTISISAHMREQAFEGQPPDLARDVRRLRDDVPVVLELENVGSVVVPMRGLTSGR